MALAQSAAPVAYVPSEPWGVDADDDLAHRRFAALCAARHSLTPQESACCYHLLRGLCGDAEIARAMYVALATVKGHLAIVRSTLGMPTRECVVLALWPLYRRARAAVPPGGARCSTG